jgi:hypothetical protein
VLVVVLDLWPDQQTEDDHDYEYDRLIPALSSSSPSRHRQIEDDHEHEYPGKPGPFWVRHEHCHE